MATMEDVLEVYQHPYDPLRPVVCIDETNKQRIKENRIPCESGQPEKVDSVYERNGVMDVFMISEPFAGRRETVDTDSGRFCKDIKIYVRCAVPEDRKDNSCHRQPEYTYNGFII